MISAIRQGDDFAFEQAFVLYRQKVYAYFIHKHLSVEDAADQAQQVFLKLWKYRKSLNEQFSFEQQLFYICRNVLIDFIRKQNRKPAVSVNLDDHTQETATISLMQDVELKMQLNSALSSLPELRKKIFVLHKLEGYSYKEIAQMLSIPVKSVDNNLTKALRHLRKVFTLCLVLALRFFF